MRGWEFRSAVRVKFQDSSSFDLRADYSATLPAYTRYNRDFLVSFFPIKALRCDTLSADRRSRAPKEQGEREKISFLLPRRVAALRGEDDDDTTTERAVSLSGHVAATGIRKVEKRHRETTTSSPWGKNAGTPIRDGHGHRRALMGELQELEN